MGGRDIHSSGRIPDQQRLHSGQAAYQSEQSLGLHPIAKSQFPVVKVAAEVGVLAQEHNFEIGMTRNPELVAVG